MKGKKHNGEHHKPMRHEYAKGGHVEKMDDGDEDDRPARKAGGKIDGKAAKHHLGRSHRKSGGRAGADKNPIAKDSAKPKAPAKVGLNESDKTP